MRGFLFALTMPLSLAVPAQAAPPQKVGTCVSAVIKVIATRFDEKLIKPKLDDIDQGTSVVLSNNTYGVSYSFVEAIFNSRVGDRVLTCLVVLPENCPKGDGRGKFYTTTNLRTRESWTLPDASHTCGGA